MENLSNEEEKLLERLRANPELARSMQEMVDELELGLAEGGSLDETEERVVVKLRRLGLAMVEARAERIEAEAPVPVGIQVRRHGKKKSAG